MLDTPAEISQRYGEHSENYGWTVEVLRERLAEAAHTLRRLPWPKYARPKPQGTAWPDVVYDWLAYGWLPARAGRIPPTPYEITRMDEMLPMLHWLTRDQRLIVWCRANHWGWRRIEALDELERNGKGRTSGHLRNIMHDGEQRILSRLNGTPGRMVVTDGQVQWK
jgi:hypothetical protein